ncbi:MAG: hypothetical protein EOM23_02105 [Candidatus Moranbacteria bacterium]|nr:hypothetical protein [Candidatus Moranbacteria bacterium]
MKEDLSYKETKRLIEILTQMLAYVREIEGMGFGSQKPLIDQFSNELRGLKLIMKLRWPDAKIKNN